MFSQISQMVAITLGNMLIEERENLAMFIEKIGALKIKVWSFP